MNIAAERVRLDERTLACPAFGSSYLHHGKVVAYDRDEDAAYVRPTIIDADVRMEMVANDRCNPNVRRHGLTIEFWCEGCGGDVHELNIAQHKGETFIEWR